MRTLANISLPRPRSAVGRAVSVRFRLPRADDPTPGSRRLAGVCAWAGALGSGGILIGLRVLVTLFAVDGGWYRPTILFIGLIGVLATVGAFASVHRRRMPWIMLSIGTAALVIAFVVTVIDAT